MTLSSSESDPILSIVVTLYTLILLYFPSLILSSLPILTPLLLLSLFRHSANHKNQSHVSLNHEKQAVVPLELLKSKSISVFETRQNPCYVESFVEWDVRAPLEVIYEGEREDKDHFLDEKRENQMDIIEKYASLSKFYPETDSDSDSDSWSEKDFMETSEWESPESPCFSWELAEDKHVLIEIELQESGCFEIEEDDMIEIDLSPANTSAPAGSTMPEGR